MRNYLFIFLLLPQFVFAVAQSDSSKQAPHSYAGLDVGIGFTPYSSSVNSGWLYYLKPGYSINLTGRAGLFHSGFGIEGRLSFWSNTFDMSKYMSDAYGAQTAVSVSYGGFYQVTTLAGPSYMVSFNKVSLELRALGGMQLLTLPNNETQITGPYPQPQYTDTYTYKTDVAFAFDGGICLGYAVSKKLSATFNIDMLVASVHYDQTEYKDYHLGVDYTYFRSYTANITMVGATIGVYYRF